MAVRRHDTKSLFHGSSSLPRRALTHMAPLAVSTRARAWKKKDQDQPIDLPRFRSRNAANSSHIRNAAQNSLLTGIFLQFNREFLSAEKQPCRRIDGGFGIGGRHPQHEFGRNPNI